jgi:uncharacterized protein YmfQ (DUF2313 family)
MRECLELAQAQATHIRLEGESTPRQKQFFSDICAQFGYTVEVTERTVLFTRVKP